MIQKILQRLSPLQIFISGFLLNILIGSILLYLPISAEPGVKVSFIDAIFTATSATCVTGLVVQDTAATFSRFGETVIMLSIQIGGLSFMTFSVLLSILLGKKIGLKERMVIQQAFHNSDLQGLVKLVVSVFTISFIAELIGMILLAIRFVPDMGISQGTYYALFHSISAFNNSGFDLFGHVHEEFSSLIYYATDPLVNFTITALTLTGGIGFLVVIGLINYPKTRRLSLHVKLTLTVTGLIIAISTVLFLILEWNNPHTLGALSLQEKLTVGLFQGSVPRTAGFSTLNAADSYLPTQMLFMLVMLIGASPNSTGGGIKTTTIALIYLTVWAMIRRKEDIEVFKRRISNDFMYRALGITMMYFALIPLLTILLSITETQNFNVILFEAVSAAGTAGLSLGLTPELSLPGKLFIIVTMFMGRIGPLSLLFALAHNKTKESIRYPTEPLILG
ncbi:Trk family potassium uptake protein [Hazenella sp. IB182357]|uniref:Trk family potassium uptake protein n=1 Tax=Polycladospora coralii TaxID=2771432 RepID=A0A926NGC3_9BACL|nr:TrkH family potassium uptake protein [Polycladospora coralii]MBD1373074.1 Trk family potassium uptake protein [Polycladospora coralii]